MNKKHGRFGAAVVISGIVVITIACLAIWGLHRMWSRYEQADSLKLEKSRKYAISRVQHSRFGSQELRNQAASEFFGEDSVADDCRWSGHPLWHGSESNPNWFSNTKGSDGFRVVCDVDVTHGQDDDELSFYYEWSDDWGVKSVSWDRIPDFSDE